MFGSRTLLSISLCLVCASYTWAQTPKPEDAEVVKSALANFKTERETALKIFTKEEVAAADEQAAKAESLLSSGKIEAARRVVTDARWLLPMQQPGLPESVIRVLGASRLRHGDRVNSIVYTPDSTRLVSGSRDGTVRVWDVGNGRETLVYRGHETEKFNDVGENAKPSERINIRRVPAVSISPDGKSVASCGAKVIHIWDIATGKELAVLSGHKADVNAVTFSPTDGNVLLSGGDDKKFMVWDIKAKKPSHTSDELNSTVNSVAFSPDGNWMAAGDQTGGAVIFRMGKWDRPGYGGTVTDSGALYSIAFAKDNLHVFVGGKTNKANMVVGPAGPEAQVGSKVRSFESMKNAVAVAPAPDGKMLLTLSDVDRTAIAWEIETGKQLRVYQGEPNSRTGCCLAVRPDGKQLAVGYETGLIRLFALANVDEHRAFSEAKDNLWSCAFSPDGKLFATAGAEGVVRVYDAESGTLKKELTGHKLAVTSVVFLSNTTLASAGGDRIVKIWDINAATAKDFPGHELAILAMASDATGKQLLSGSADRTLRGWEVGTGKELWKLDLRSAVCAISFNPAGKRVAVGTADGKLHIYDVVEAGLKLLYEQSAHAGGIASVAFHLTNDKLATGGGDGLVKLWSIQDNGSLSQLRVYEAPYKVAGGTQMPVTSVAFSPDGKQLVGAGAEGVNRIWETFGGGEIRPLRGHTAWVTSVAYSPDGRSVLSCGVDKVARYFDLPRADAVPTGHTDTIQCIAVSRDGKLIATGGGDRLLKIWDAASGRETITLVDDVIDKESTLLAIAFLGNDQIIGSAKDKKIRTWNIKTGKLVSTTEQANLGIALAAAEDGNSFSTAWVSEAQSEKRNGGFTGYAGAAEPKIIEVKTKDKTTSTNCVAISPDAKWGVLGSVDGSLQFWDVTNKSKVGGDWALVKGAVFDLGITPDRKRIVVMDDSGEVIVGDTEKREVLTKFKAVKSEPIGVIVSPTADKFMTLGGDGEVKAWSMAGKELRTWKLPFPPTCAVFTIDGQRVMCGNSNGTALVLELPK